ncbi:MAG: hypothetical protein HY203_08710 [Nitrospirae bacterium]|nr:hypothetical protein [Nitrospirota bacterium]
MAREYLVAEEAIGKLVRAVEKTTKRPVEIILLGGLAMALYGRRRKTRDLDAEIPALTGAQLGRLLRYLNIPADLSKDVSHWGMIDLPPGYRGRAKRLWRKGRITVRVLSPLDLVMSKLRVMRESDIQDALYLIRRFKLTRLQIRRAMSRMIKASIPSTDLFFFEKFMEGFLKKRVRR